VPISDHGNLVLLRFPVMNMNLGHSLLVDILSYRNMPDVRLQFNNINSALYRLN